MAAVKRESNGEESNDLAKKRKIDGILGTTAEIVLVLAGLGQMRGGRLPTPVEMDLMLQAQGNLARLISRLSPKSLVSKESIEKLISDMGFRRAIERREALSNSAQIDGDQELKEPFAEEKEIPTLASTLADVTTEEDLKSPLHAEIPENPHIANGQEHADLIHDVSSTVPYGLLEFEGMNMEHDPNDLQASSFTHMQLVKLINKLIPSSVAIEPNSLNRSYMNTPLPCMICKTIIKDTGSAIVCDGCEKVSHVKCIQPLYLKGVPKDDWFCPKCAMENKGQQPPPVYRPIKGSSRVFTSKSRPADGHGLEEDAEVPTTSISQNHVISNGSSLLAPAAVIPVESQVGSQVCSRDAPPSGVPDHVEVFVPQPEVGQYALDAARRGDESKASYLNENGSSHTNSNGALEDSGREGLHQGVMTTPILMPSAEGLLAQAISGANMGLVQIGNNMTGQNLVYTDETQGPGTNQPDDMGQPPVSVKWVGDALQVIDGKAYYGSCHVGEHTYKLHDCALFRPESPEIPPYIARLQVLWEDVDTGAKWVKVNWCYYPNDMPSVAGRPAQPEPDEVYESNHSDSNLVGSIQGPCHVLTPQRYYTEKERRAKLQKSGSKITDLHPIYICRWLYDAPKGIFRKVAEGA